MFMFVSKIYEELTHKEVKTALHTLNSFSYFNVRDNYTGGEDIQKSKTNYADITQGKQKNPYYDGSVLI